MSPYECLFHSIPDYKYLKIFGCECWPFLRPYNSSKLSFRSSSCVFIGYSKNHLGYKCLHIPSGKVYIARHVVFDENSFPFLTSKLKTSSSSPQIPSSLLVPYVPSSTSPTSGSSQNTPSITPPSSTSASSLIEPLTTSPTLQPTVTSESPSSSESTPSP